MSNFLYIQRIPLFLQKVKIFLHFGNRKRPSSIQRGGALPFLPLLQFFPQGLMDPLGRCLALELPHDLTHQEAERLFLLALLLTVGTWLVLG